MSKSPKQKRQKTLSEFFVTASEGCSTGGDTSVRHSSPIKLSTTISAVEREQDIRSSSQPSARELANPAINVELDIGNFIPQSKNVDDQKIYDYLTNHWKPDSSYKFPRIERKVKNKTVFLSFQHEWLRQFNWLAYSPSQNGAFCKYCRVFAPEEGGGARLKTFVKIPMRNLKDAKADMAEHSKKAYHLTAKLRAESFLKAHVSGNVVERMSSARSQQVEINRRGLASIIDTVKLCGRQNIALRGHRDSGVLENPSKFETLKNEGNFRALLRFRIAAGDADFKEYVEKAPLNALYTSWRIQNEIIELCGDEIRKKIIQKINKAQYFAVLADETTDIQKREQFSICIRYVSTEENNEGYLREDFLGFEVAKNLSGQSLAVLLMETLAKWGLNLEAMVGQGYDGAANMSGRFRGVQAIVKEAQPKALYTHCSSHRLNLVISHACGGATIKKTTRTIHDIIVFFTSSPKRTTILKDAIAAILPNS